MQNIYKKLNQVQSELKAPKSQINKFGNYNYRNQEDILEAVKPLLHKYNLALYLQDNIVFDNSRHYVEATATLVDIESGATIVTKALAREEEVKKGMDGSQITGASSSYARKYCLNGLFLIDDTKDSDYTNGIEAVNHYIEKKNATAPVVEPVKPSFSTDKCENCGAGIITAVAVYSKNKFGKKLCRTCQEKENKWTKKK